MYAWTEWALSTFKVQFKFLNLSKEKKWSNSLKEQKPTARQKAANVLCTAIGLPSFREFDYLPACAPYANCHLFRPLAL